MKRLTLLILYILTCTWGFVQAQDGVVDSLKRLTVTSQEDTAKVNLLISLGQAYEYSLPDSAAYFYGQARELSEKLNYPAGIVRYNTNYISILLAKGELDAALLLCLEALQLCEQYRLSDLQMASALANTGLVYQSKEDFTKAIEYDLQAIPLLEKLKRYDMLSTINGNLMDIYRKLKQPDKALEFARRSLDDARQIDNPQMTGAALINLGVAYQSLHQWKEALQYQREGYDIGLHINDIGIQMIALINIGDISVKTNAEPDDYIATYQKVLPLAESFSHHEAKYQALYGIAYGTFAKRRYAEAEAQAKAILEAASEDNIKNISLNAITLLRDIANATGRHALAQQYALSGDSIETQLHGEELQKNIQELETKYDVEKNRAEVLEQKLLVEQKSIETQQQRFWLIVSAVFIILLLLLMLAVFRSYRHRQLLNKKAMEAMQAEHESVRLKSLLEGQSQERQRIAQEMHDDMGTELTSLLYLIRSLQEKNPTSEKLLRSTQSLTKKMNEIIWAMNPEQDTLENLIAYMRQHIAETLDNAGLEYAFAMTDPLPDMPLKQVFRRNIYLVTKEAVHNIVRHAHASRVNIDIQVTGELRISIRDNGVGISPEKTNRFGNGLKNMQQRMTQIKGTFEITSGGGGTCAAMRAPLNV
ncbi:MAG: tetratricopeptide repeat protein [Tannerella sp.]|jgi:signal transduction histidine kinase|nr:tetratricopeptide repeat protein [Tannerella sp.]